MWTNTKHSDSAAWDNTMGKRLISNKLQLLNFFIKEKKKEQACLLDSVLILLCTLFKKGKEEGR